MPNPQKSPKSGWFVEIPTDLKQAFKARYPSRSAMTKLTIWAINQALSLEEPRDNRLNSTNNLPSLSTPLSSEDA